MGMRTGLLLPAVVLASCGGADDLPPYLAGTWAPEDAVLEGSSLVRGEVLHLTRHGVGAAWGSGPPPVGARVLARFDRDTQVLELLGLPAGSLGGWEPVARLAPDGARLLTLRPEGRTYVLRSADVPADVRAKGGPETWADERARRPDLFREGPRTR